jgi:hypothetical protein
MRIAEVLVPATAGGAFPVKKRIGFYPRVGAEGGGRGVVSQAGAVLLVETACKTGLDAAMSAALEPWRKPRAVHDPGKILLDVALALALGGDCLADVALLRAEPAVFGPVASDPTVSQPSTDPHTTHPAGADAVMKTFSKVLTEDHTVEDGRARLLHKHAEQQTTPLRRAAGTRPRPIAPIPTPAPDHGPSPPSRRRHPAGSLHRASS